MEKYWPIRLTSEQVGGDDSSGEDSDSDSDSDSEDDKEPIEDDRGQFASPPPPTSSPAPSSPAAGDSDNSDEDNLNPNELYAKKRAALLQTRCSGFNGWSAELRSWLRHVPSNVRPETDLCKYWAVCFTSSTCFSSLLIRHRTTGTDIPPSHALSLTIFLRMALPYPVNTCSLLVAKHLPTYAHSSAQRNLKRSR